MIVKQIGNGQWRGQSPNCDKGFGAVRIHPVITTPLPRSLAVLRELVQVWHLILAWCEECFCSFAVMTAAEANVESKIESLGSFIPLSQSGKPFSGLGYFNSLISDKEIAESIPCDCVTEGHTLWIHTQVQPWGLCHTWLWNQFQALS